MFAQILAVTLIAGAASTAPAPKQSKAKVAGATTLAQEIQSLRQSNSKLLDALKGARSDLAVLKEQQLAALAAAEATRKAVEAQEQRLAKIEEAITESQLAPESVLPTIPPETGKYETPKRKTVIPAS